MPDIPNSCRRVALAASLLAALGAGACTRPATPGAEPAGGAVSKGDERLAPQYDTAGKLQKLEYDRDGNGKPDTWGYMDGARVVRVEVDENGDGKVDRWEHHRAVAVEGAGASAAAQAVLAAPDKTVERIERATRFDGQVSRVEFFENGTLVKIEEDTDGNGKTDKWETYAAGALSVMALDTTGRGTPDRRLVYGADGSLDHIEEDPTGSGTFKAIKP